MSNYAKKLRMTDNTEVNISFAGFGFGTSSNAPQAIVLTNSDTTSFEKIWDNLQDGLIPCFFFAHHSSEYDSGWFNYPIAHRFQVYNGSYLYYRSVKDFLDYAKTVSSSTTLMLTFLYRTYDSDGSISYEYTEISFIIQGGKIIAFTQNQHN